MDAGEFITTGADRTWQWFIHMQWWAYVLLVALVLLAAYLIRSFFREDPTELVEAEIPDFPQEFHGAEGYQNPETITAPQDIRFPGDLDPSSD